ENEVDPYLGAARVSLEDQSVSWMAPVKGMPGWRLGGNIFSTRSSLARALCTEVPGIPGRIMEAMDSPSEFKMVQMPDEYTRIDPDDLPLPTYFKSDGGPYVTSGIFHAGWEDASNVSFHRMMYMGSGRFAVRVVPRHLKTMIDLSRKEGQDLEAVVSIGTDPSALLGGSISLPYGKDEMKVASTLHMLSNGEALSIFSPTDNERGLGAPLGTEIVIRGRFIDERAPEGPFVDITSTLDHSGMEPGEPVFSVDEVLVRRDPIMHVLLPGGFEHFLLMGLPKEPAILASVRKVVSRAHAVRLTEGGCSWLHGVVSITKQKEGDAKNAIMAAFSGHPSMKKVIVVDSDIDVFNDQQIEWALATRFQADRDIVVVRGAHGSTLDPSQDMATRTTSKLGMDATMPTGASNEFKRVEVG
ncbi:MAG: UbiD family decarboxylase, partial [Candidatus Thermoplasmatota archaeon]|nr:UbiD family decarboxylase [Candidatus Thermoplasmatota archaeon]